MILEMTVPEPPSANRYWRMVQGHLVLSKEAKTYRKTVADAYLRTTGRTAITFAAQPLSVTLCWYRCIKAGDLDNRIKQILDALRGCAYTDDSQIIEIHAYREDAPRNARLDLTIETLPEPGTAS